MNSRNAKHGKVAQLRTLFTRLLSTHFTFHTCICICICICCSASHTLHYFPHISHFNEIQEGEICQCHHFNQISDIRAKMVLKAQYVPKPPFGHFLLLSNFLWMSSSSYFSRRHNLAKIQSPIESEFLNQLTPVRQLQHSNGHNSQCHNVMFWTSRLSLYIWCLI